MFTKNRFNNSSLRVVISNKDVIRSNKSYIELEVLKTSNNKYPIQLGLPINCISPNSVCSVGMENLSFEGLFNILKEFNIKNFIELRVAPDYRDFGFSTQKFKLFLKANLIEYFHYPEITNKFIATHMNYAVVISKYRKYLEQEKSKFEKIYFNIQNGPTLLFSYQKEYENSDRMFLLESLLSKGNEINVIDLNCHLII